MEKPTPKNDEAAAAGDRIKDSAQQIWLAGLGAFAKAQQEGSKVFESLVKDGAGMQKKTQQAAEETLAQAQARMSGFASEFGAKAVGQWGKLENIFEERVAKALEKIGVPSAAEIQALKARVTELEARLASQSPAGSAPHPARKTAATRKADEAPAKKPSRRRPKL
ncbi:phasin family protein [Variovorax sp. J22G21]|uniref:phasin family protein n=1 Tax=Variovorax fucosicus TaxID=3053517 RepID=UPI002576019E|nr:MULTISPECIES: phasin family protein [unclassified Variovorax]MDM0038534.1 phasin family protein [Variovorax sp. J22R193]MDM0063310.1 phasin family protein [Variovorax sp. J22G21]